MKEEVSGIQGLALVLRTPPEDASPAENLVSVPSASVRPVGLVGVDEAWLLDGSGMSCGEGVARKIGSKSERSRAVICSLRLSRWSSRFRLRRGCSCLILPCQVSSQPSLHTALRSSNMGFTVLTGRLILWGCLAPIRLRTHFHQFLQHPRSQLGQSLIHRHLNLTERCRWALCRQSFMPVSIISASLLSLLWESRSVGRLLRMLVLLSAVFFPVYHPFPFRETLNRTHPLLTDW